jgi:NIMA (never in mitosis gene a)-related kinase
MEKYTRGKVLGKGSFGKASVVVSKVDGTTHVLKEIDISKMSKKERESSLQEAQVLSLPLI